jgi:hypothetical protein
MRFTGAPHASLVRRRAAWRGACVVMAP